MVTIFSSLDICRFHGCSNQDAFLPGLHHPYLPRSMRLSRVNDVLYKHQLLSLFFQVVSLHSTSMVKGMLSLLTICPDEVAHLRKELLIAARHILATELRIKFVPYMEK